MTAVAIVHDWLTGMRGGEKVLEAICALYPDAVLHTLVHVRGSTSPSIERHPIRTSPVQWLPAAGRIYRHCLPLFPAAVELFDLDDYDLVLSTSHCAAKSVIRSGRAVHVCYCHSPMRYAWDQFPSYFGPEQVGATASRLLRPVMAALARWDASTAGRVDRFLANSQYVAGRIHRYYNRGSSIVYPPVSTTFYHPSDTSRSSDTYALVVSALVPYKRVDAAIEGCRLAGLPLRIIGRGPEEARLRAQAGPDVEFLGWQSDEEIRAAYQGATVVLMPGVEDFGIVPVEAQACGTPVVALGQGGARETVLDGVTGILIDEASGEGMAEGIARARRTSFDRDALVSHAQRFSVARFKTAFRSAVDATVAERGPRP